jgi:hypothetical protein
LAASAARWPRPKRVDQIIRNVGRQRLQQGRGAGSGQWSHGTNCYPKNPHLSAKNQKRRFLYAYSTFKTGYKSFRNTLLRGPSFVTAFTFFTMQVLAFTIFTPKKPSTLNPQPKFQSTFHHQRPVFTTCLHFFTYSHAAFRSPATPASPFIKNHQSTQKHIQPISFAH